MSKQGRLARTRRAVYDRKPFSSSSYSFRTMSAASLRHGVATPAEVALAEVVEVVQGVSGFFRQSVILHGFGQVRLLLPLRPRVLVET